MILRTTILASMICALPAFAAGGTCTITNIYEQYSSTQKKDITCDKAKCTFDPSIQITLGTCGQELGLWTIKCSNSSNSSFVPESVTFNCTSGKVDMIYPDSSVDDIMKQTDKFTIDAINRHDSDQKKSKLYEITCGSTNLTQADTILKGDGDQNCSGDPSTDVTEPEWTWVNQ
jgi:hypothetical protein